MTRIISIVGGLQPSTPTIGTATAGDTTASVAFTPSTYIGKGTITYTATSSPGGITGTASSSPITVTGLTNGTAYTFTVTGTTNYGVTSIASSASNSITPALGDVGSMFPIGSVRVSSTTSSITFSSIPSTYTHLQIRGLAASNRTGFIVNNYTMRVNGDSGSNYRSHYMQGGYSTSPVASSGNSGPESFYYMPTGTTGVVNAWTGIVIDILDYKNTNKNKVFKTLIGYDINGTAGTSSYGGAVSLCSGLWLNTSAITSITLAPEGFSWIADTSFALYGIKGA